MTLLQRNFVTAKPINFYYLVCKLDRVQYPVYHKWLFIFSNLILQTTSVKNNGRGWIVTDQHHQRPQKPSLERKINNNY